MLFVKIILVALSLLVQKKVFSGGPDPESPMDSVTFPEEKPEWVLARRAMEAQGLCPVSIANPSGNATDSSLPPEGAKQAIADGNLEAPAGSEAGGLFAVCF